MKDEALKLALEALEKLTDTEQTYEALDLGDKAITAIKQALAAPVQEPVAWRNAAIRVGEDLCSVGPFGYYDMTAEQWLDWALSVVTVHAPPRPPAPVQEPLGFMNAGHVHEMQQGRLPYGYVYPKGGNGASVAVYTAPLTQPAFVQEPVAWVREHELPLAPGDAFSWVETFVHKTPLYTTPPAAQPAPSQDPTVPTKVALELVTSLVNENQRLKAEIKFGAATPAAPVQEPWESSDTAHRPGGLPQEFVCSTGLCHYKAQPAPVQEPHSWYSAEHDEWMTDKTRKEHERLNSYTHKVGGFDLPLYTTPPAAQRQWVGMTDEEKRQIFEREDYQGWLDYINAIEAKLKEKNT